MLPPIMYAAYAGASPDKTQFVLWPLSVELLAYMETPPDALLYETSVFLAMAVPEETLKVAALALSGAKET